MLVGLWPGRAAAQLVATSLDELQGRVALGETVKVIDQRGETITGKLTRLTTSELTVIARTGERTIPGANITQVKARRADPLWNGALIGAASALIPLGILGAALRDGGDCDCAGTLTFWAGIGAVAGMGIDARLQGNVTVMKRASGRSQGLTVTPIIQRGRRGVLASIRF
jgi:hypothetical protein